MRFVVRTKSSGSARTTIQTAVRSRNQRDQDRLDSEGALVEVGRSAVKLSPRDAAVLRKLGSYVDSADSSPMATVFP